ncbi:disease resistance-like protein DSC1 isoform X2 [Malus domestica]|uniref:disease resistance-like protein DSC1 isoform X2 n=1 Tax=Malus domestica TaxID=3750 RepID=UPI0010AACD42|nr:disease resistance-like protein DSC1 isoform X3 [Malus domestica]
MKNLKSLVFKTNSDIAACGSDGIARDGWGLRRLFGLEKSRPDPPPCWGLVLSSLNRLCYLTNLSLENCNLREGDIPDDIGCLSLLEKLCLSRNNFVSLPESIRHLSKLKILRLEGCKSLQKLPPLPSNRGLTVKLNNCTSLRRISGAFNLYDASVTCWNCIVLVPDEDLINRILKFVIQGSEIVIFGSEIPKWFNNQSVGHSLNVELPPLSCTNWLGIAFCLVFQFQGPRQNVEPTYWYWIIRLRSGRFVGHKIRGMLFHWNTLCNTSPVLENLWVFYLPRKYCFPREDYHQDQFLFQITTNFEFERYLIADLEKVKKCEVKKCGARLVYEQDLKELNQKLLKRTREIRDEAALSGSGSASFNDTEQIHKRRCN